MFWSDEAFGGGFSLKFERICAHLACNFPFKRFT
jgi:hypothetical protein